MRFSRLNSLTEQQIFYSILMAISFSETKWNDYFVLSSFRGDRSFRPLFPIGIVGLRRWNDLYTRWEIRKRSLIINHETNEIHFYAPKSLECIIIRAYSCPRAQCSIKLLYENPPPHFITTKLPCVGFSSYCYRYAQNIMIIRRSGF